MLNQFEQITIIDVTADNVSDVGIYCIKDRKLSGYRLLHRKSYNYYTPKIILLLLQHINTFSSNSPFKKIKKF